MCRACSEAVVAAASFKHLCTQSFEHWDNATSYLSQIHESSEDDKTYFIFYNEKTVIKDQIDRTPSVDEALDMLNRKYKEKPDRRRIRRERDIPGTCPTCGKEFSSPENLNVHLKTTLSRACEECGIVMPKHKLAKHYYVEHEIEVVDCNTCQAIFYDQDSLRQHWTEAHTTPHSCTYCGHGFPTSRALRAHMYCHSLFHCKSCNLSFDNMKCFKYHQKQCKVAETPALNNFVCNDCGAAYDRKPSLRIHIIQKHLNVLPYVCEICSKRTSTLGHLKSHEKTHKTARKIYQCYCGAKLRTELGYQLHQRIHTGERPYECEVCGDRFLSSSRRLDHIKRRHRGTEDMPHVCEQCAARFVRPCELRKHYLTIHSAVVDVMPAKRKIKEEPLVPIGACVSCATTALAAQEFRVFVKNSEKIWQKAIENMSVITAAPPTKSIVAVIKPTDLSIQTYKELKKTDPKNLINRLKNKTPKKIAEKKHRGARTGPSCNCPDCDKSFISPFYLNMHLRNSGHKDACIICGEIVVRGDGMKQHLETVHKQDVVICNRCPTLCSNQAELKKHIKKAHKPGVFTCRDCGRTFPRRASFDFHAQMHAVRTCRACEAQFTNRSCYREHRANCEPDAKPKTTTVPRNRRSNIRDPATFTCDHCGKTYISRAQLKNHIIWIHMDIRPHQCQWCGKRFYTPARLAEHTVVHTRVRNFECDICGVKLVSKMAVVYHRRRHTGEKPYECEDCGEKFISASRRSEHAKRRHNRGLKLPCLKCPASFVRKHELKKHMEKAHRTAPEDVLGW